MGTYGTSDEKFKELVERVEKQLGRKLTPEEIQGLRKIAE
jgi:DNA replication protein DnaD